MIEVEDKWQTRKKQVGKIISRLVRRGCRVVPSKQRDTYLHTADPKLTDRVREQQDPEGVHHLKTSKRKCEAPAKAKGGKRPKFLRNSNNERERNISKRRHNHLVRTKRMTAFGSTVYVIKKRVHVLDLIYRGYEVTVAVDKARGPGDIKLGRFVEFETMVDTCRQVKKAKKALQQLAREILPKGAKREYRGYRTMVLQALAQRVGKTYDKAKLRKATQKADRKAAKKRNQTKTK